MQPEDKNKNAPAPSPWQAVGLLLEAARPESRTEIPNLFLAGDWTRSGWPATMEGAVRSGYLAAESVAASLGKAQKFILPDIA